MPFPTKRFYVAGVQHHQLHKVINDVTEGNFLVIESEPENKFDPNAVRLIYGNGQKEEMVGYVPKKFSSDVSAALEIGTDLICEVTTLTPSAKPWEQIEVEIKEVTEDE